MSRKDLPHTFETDLFVSLKAIKFILSMEQAKRERENIDMKASMLLIKRDDIHKHLTDNKDQGLLQEE